MSTLIEKGETWVKRKVSDGLSRLLSLGPPQSGDCVESIEEIIVKIMSEEAYCPAGAAEDESSPDSEMSHLFQLPFFAPLLCKHLSDEDIIRLSSCSRGLNKCLAPEVKSIKEKRLERGAALVSKGTQPDALELLLCLTCACVQSCVKGTMRPLEIYITRVAFGPNGFHSDAVGYSNIGEIFEFVNNGDDWEGAYYF